MSYRIRPASRKELDVVVQWAAKEGWNPGLYDADSFYNTDPKGFFLGVLDDEPIASLSAVSYDTSFGFLGFYIVKPEHRAKGYGMKLWCEALQHLPTQNIGLDGVLAQQENYKKSGFTLAYKNIRFEGKGTRPNNTSHVVLLSEIPFSQVQSYDDTIFPVRRGVFLKSWINQPESLAIGINKNGILVGYGMVRKCHTGWKVGPLFADSPHIADTLFQKLLGYVGNGAKIFLDVPEVNIEAVALAKRYQMKPMFETARMYTKHAPIVPMQKVFGVTTFELG